MIEQKLYDLGADLKVAFQPLALIDILLEEDVAYYIYINEILQKVTSSHAKRKSIYSKVLGTLLGDGIRFMFYGAQQSHPEYERKINRIYDMVKNVPFKLGITAEEQELVNEALTVEELPRWFKDQLIIPPNESNIMNCAVDTTQYNLFVLRPVDESCCKIELIGAEKSTTDKGEYVLSAVDTSIRDFLRFNTFEAAISKGLVGLFTKLASTHPLL